MSAETRVSPPALARLEADGFVVQVAGRWKTGRRWQQAMARAAMKLFQEGDAGDDLRVPIALAMIDVYAGALDDETLADLVLAMLPIEIASLGFPAAASKSM